jgi:hypothetical protein
MSNRLIANKSSMTSKKEIAKPMSHPFGVRRPNTMALILSVTEANVYPGLMTGGGLVSVLTPSGEFSCTVLGSL